MKAWWITFFVWVSIFLALSAVIILRTVDGSGLYQTTELKLASVIVLAVFFLPVLIGQLIWLIVLLRRKSHNE